jgi:hypothetical protein
MHRRAQQGRARASVSLLRQFAARLAFLLFLSAGLVFHAQGEPGVAFASVATLAAIADHGDCAPATGHDAGGCVATHSCSSSHAGCSALLIASTLIDSVHEAGPLPAGALVVAALGIAPPSRPPIASSKA